MRVEASGSRDKVDLLIERILGRVEMKDGSRREERECLEGSLQTTARRSTKEEADGPTFSAKRPTKRPWRNSRERHLVTGIMEVSRHRHKRKSSGQR